MLQNHSFCEFIRKLKGKKKKKPEELKCRVTCKDRDDLLLFSTLLEYWAKVKFTMDRSLENMDLIKLLSNLHSGSVINCGISMNCSTITS